jgi:hypothetical protein
MKMAKPFDERYHPHVSTSKYRKARQLQPVQAQRLMEKQMQISGQQKF